jgi:DNA topoisomerase-1
MKTKFQSLEHNGPLFPKEFDEITEIDVQGAKITGLPLEMLWNYAKYLDTEYVKDPVFVSNFKKCLFKASKPQERFDFPRDYQAALVEMKKIQEQLKEQKKNRTKVEKDLEKKSKEKIKADYGFAIIDGTKQPIGNYMIEPPGLFLARGKSPIKGMWKYRVTPEKVTINCTGNAPAAPKGHHWKKIEANLNNFYTYSFDVNIGDTLLGCKHIRFSYNSDIGHKADQHKFDKAENLLRNWNKMQDYITANYTTDKKLAKHGDDKSKIECAVIAWLIQNTSIRIGHDPDEKIGAETVGATSLKVNNVEVVDNTMSYSLKLDFLGKDSIHYKNEFTFSDKDIAIRIGQLINGKKPNDNLFSVSSGDVNAFLQSCIDDTSAKIFRPVMGTSILVKELLQANVDKTQSVSEKLLAFTKANIKTAELLNHKKAASKNHDAGIEKMNDTLKSAKDRVIEIRKENKDKAAKLKKDAESTKKVFEGEKLKEANARIKAKLDKLVERLNKAEERVANLEGKLSIKKDTKETAIGTSRGSYLDPRVLVSWAKDVELPIEKIYTKSLQARFAWAMNTPATFWKGYVK